MKSRISPHRPKVSILPKIRTNSQTDITPATAAELGQSPPSTYKGPKFIWKGKEYPDFSYKPPLSRRRVLSFNATLSLPGAKNRDEQSPISIDSVARIRSVVISEMLNKTVDDVKVRFDELREQETTNVIYHPFSKSPRFKPAMLGRSPLNNTYLQAAALPQKSKRRLKQRLTSVMPKESHFTRLSVLEESLRKSM